jgi:hypothetical protein
MMEARLLLLVAALVNVKLQQAINAQVAHQLLQTHALRSAEMVSTSINISATMATKTMEMDAAQLARSKEVMLAVEEPPLQRTPVLQFVVMV